MNRYIDIDLARALVAVIDNGGFTAAAETLARSQSAISMQIRKLEELVDGRILERSNQGVRLTSMGERLLPYARKLIAISSEAIRHTKGDDVTGVVRLAVMDDYATHVLPRLLNRFSVTRPGIELQVTTGFTAELMQGLGRQFDLVLATQAVGTGNGEVLRVENVRWAFSDKHDLPEGQPIPLAVLKEGNLFREWAIAALSAQGRPWRVIFSSTSIGAVESFCAEGLAVTIAKESTMRAGLRFLDQKDGMPKLPAAEIALHSTPAPQSPAISALAAYLKFELQKPALRTGAA